MQVLKNKTGVEYPIDKLDIVAVPGEATIKSARIGLMFVPEKYILEYSSSFKDKKMMANLVASLWFKNMITPKWWNDTWIADGFETLFEYEVRIFKIFIIKISLYKILGDIY